jgi:hypothetical protein
MRPAKPFVAKLNTTDAETEAISKCQREPQLIEGKSNLECPSELKSSRLSIVPGNGLEWGFSLQCLINDKPGTKQLLQHRYLKI